MACYKPPGECCAFRQAGHQDEVERLKHDIERHISIVATSEAEIDRVNGRLKTMVALARSFAESLIGQSIAHRPFEDANGKTRNGPPWAATKCWECDREVEGDGPVAHKEGCAVARAEAFAASNQPFCPMCEREPGDLCCMEEKAVNEFVAGRDVRGPDGWIDDVIRDLSELPDRNSPDDFPEALIVTGDEIRETIKRHAIGKKP